MKIQQQFSANATLVAFLLEILICELSDILRPFCHIHVAVSKRVFFHPKKLTLGLLKATCPVFLRFLEQNGGLRFTLDSKSKHVRAVEYEEILTRNRNGNLKKKMIF